MLIANYTDAGIGGYKTQPTWGVHDYWIIKFCDTTLTTSITQLPNTQLPFSTFPNPFTTTLTLKDTTQKGELIIFDITGKEILRKKLLQCGNKN